MGIHGRWDRRLHGIMLVETRIVALRHGRGETLVRGVLNSGPRARPS